MGKREEVEESAKPEHHQATIKGQNQNLLTNVGRMESDGTATKAQTNMGSEYRVPQEPGLPGV